jgi:hypothetical protein
MNLASKGHAMSQESSRIAAYDAAMAAARASLAQASSALGLQQLERAHVLGQREFMRHGHVHRLERALADQPRWAAHGNPQPELIWESIADTGLDMAKARADGRSPAIADALRQDIADMKALKVRATPGFFVNGRPLTDFGEAQLRSLVNEEVAKVRKP